MFIFINLISIFCLRVWGRTEEPWWFLPIRWPEQRECRPIFSGRLSALGLASEPLSRHRGHLACASACDLGSSSSKVGSWSSPFTLTCLLGHSPSSSDLPCLPGLFRSSAEVEIRHHLHGCWHGMVLNFPSQYPPHQTCRGAPLLHGWQCPHGTKVRLCYVGRWGWLT